MRRRDADDFLPFHGASDTRRRVLVCVAVSIALHAALLVAAATLRSARPSVPVPIHVSLVSGNGGALPGGATDADISAPAPAHALRPPASSPQPPRFSQERIQLAVRRPHTAVNAQQSAAVTVDVARESAPAVEAGASEGLGHTQDGVGDGLTGSGRGWSAGSGRGDGLDARAFCAFCPEPAYPLIARSRGWQGTVEVALLVRPDGSVNGASLGRSSGYPALDDAAMAVARLSRFHLPDNGGPPTPLRGRMEYRFVLR